MKKVLKAILTIIILLTIGAAIAWFGFLKSTPPPISQEDREQIAMMPLPAELELKKGIFKLNNGFGVKFKSITTPRLEKAVDRFFTSVSQTIGQPFHSTAEIKLILDCKNEIGEYPSIDNDESYDLTINQDKIVISANMESGILHGLESLIQLITMIDDQWGIPAMKIEDQPRFPWRGLMIDVSRHWVPKDVILRNLDAMAAVKMNVFHWHLTDYQGFRIESKVYPRLHGLGSNGDFYTQEEIKEVIEYASDRGIRVVPEFDLPGHSTSWFIGYPQLGSAEGPYSLDTLFGISDPVMDPTRDEVYEFLNKFIQEMVVLFPDQYFHIGGDEVKPKHWEGNPDITNFMIANKIADNHELQAHFNKRLQKIVKRHGKIMMGWDEILHPELPKDDISIQSWRSHASLWEAARSGSQAILSAGYYLDHKQSAEFHYKVDPLMIPGAVTIDIDSSNWKAWDCKMYIRDMEFECSIILFGEGEEQNGIVYFMEGASGFSETKHEEGKIEFEHESPFGTLKYSIEEKGDSIFGEAKIALIKLVIKGKRSGGTDMPSGIPLPKIDKIEPLTANQEKYVLGGEACMWSEMVDGRTVESRIWPRAAVVGEKLWSPKVLTSDHEDMYRRLISLDEKLEGMGIKHKESAKEIIREIVDEDYVVPLSTLVDVLKEDVLFNRMAIYDPELFTTTPLDRIVDAARPESYIAYSFNRDVDLWLENQDVDAKDRIVKSLSIWAKNHDKLSFAFHGNPRLNEIEAHSIHLSSLANWCLQTMEQPELRSSKQDEIIKILEKGTLSYGATLLQVIDGLKKLST